MAKPYLGLVLAAMILWGAQTAEAHFGMVIPSDPMVMQTDSRTVQVTFSFSHPMEVIGMNLALPARAGVVIGGRDIDLRDKLQPTKVMGHTAWRLDHAIRRPGIYTFYMEPTPYWEPAEDLFIIHYTKTVVAAFGDDEGWDAEIGLKTEIVPLCKPFGLYAGNVFQGVVKLDGKPVPHSVVEVEYYNQDGKTRAPTDYMVTQTVKADGAGLFTYSVPAAGWWGFAALNASDRTIDHEGEDKEVELGAVIWVQFLPWPANR